MLYEPVKEDLLDELTRLVGRPQPVVQDALARLLGSIERVFDRELLDALSPFPMTAWPAIAESPAPDALWSAVQASGLSAEEVLTALAVVDDHVRRRYGNGAWTRVGEWAPLLAGRYNLGAPASTMFRSAASNAP